MEQEDKDKLVEKLNQMIELSNKSITLWTRLMEQDIYPTKDCLEHINLSNKTKESCLKMIRKYGTQPND